MNTLDVLGKYGPMRVIEGDVWVSRSLAELGEYSELELRLMRFVLALLRAKGELTIVEAGAYIGDLTVPLSRLCKKLYAFEPQAEVREILEFNLAANGCDNVEVLPYALGQENQSASYTTDTRSPGSTIMGGGEDSPVEIRTLDSLGIECDFLKADVEGMELLVLAGAQKMIGRCKPTLFLERDTVEMVGAPSQEEVLKMLGYDYYPMAFPMWHPENFRKAPNTFGSTASFMTLGVPTIG